MRLNFRNHSKSCFIQRLIFLLCTNDFFSVVVRSNFIDSCAVVQNYVVVVWLSKTFCKSLKPLWLCGCSSLFVVVWRLRGCVTVVVSRRSKSTRTVASALNHKLQLLIATHVTKATHFSQMWLNAIKSRRFDNLWMEADLVNKHAQCDLKHVSCWRWSLNCDSHRKTAQFFDEKWNFWCEMKTKTLRWEIKFETAFMQEKKGWGKLGTLEGWETN